MARPQKPPGLQDFSQLSPSVWFHEPTSSRQALSRSSKEPEFILLVGWMGGSARHISKYADRYSTLYPSSRILAITTTALDAAFRTESTNLIRLESALKIIYTLPPDSKVLVHFFSNGGAATTALIAKAYREKKGRALPMSAVVMDSAPGRTVYKATVEAFAVGLPKNPILNFIGIMILRLVYVIYKLGYMLTGRVDLIERARRNLVNKDWFDVGAPRLYIYSEADRLVAWEHVEEHAEEAEKLGYSVSTEKFLNSGHVGHILVDPERYLAIIQQLWSRVA